MALKNISSKSQLTPIGKLDQCPHCDTNLDKIPKRKKKCPHCGDYIFVRTRPLDRKKVLVTEKQKSDVEREWNRYYEEKEYSQLLQDEEYQKEKKSLFSELGRDPTLAELKTSVLENQMLEYTSKRQWGLYRNCILEISETLKKEGKLEEALNSFFQVCYLDVNGANNVMTTNGKAMSYTKSEKMGILDFDTKFAFFAPAIITYIRNLISEINLSEDEARTLFIKTNEKSKPIEKMPVSPDDAWVQLKSKIEDDKKIDAFDVSNQTQVIKEIDTLIKQNKMNDLKKLLLKVRSLYKSKKYKIENVDEVKSFIINLMDSKNRNISHQGETLMLTVLKKDEIKFKSLASHYVTKFKNDFSEQIESHTIGQLGAINVELIKPLIPLLKETIRNSKEWNTRRFAAFNLGRIAEKQPDLVGDIIPVMIDYIKNPFEVTIRDPVKIETSIGTISWDMSVEKMMGVDQKQWLKDAYIDTLGMFAKGDKQLIFSYRSLIEIIAKSDKSEYSRKKAQKVLDLLDK